MWLIFTEREPVKKSKVSFFDLFKPWELSKHVTICCKKMFEVVFRVRETVFLVLLKHLELHFQKTTVWLAAKRQVGRTIFVWKNVFLSLVFHFFSQIQNWGFQVVDANGCWIKFPARKCYSQMYSTKSSFLQENEEIKKPERGFLRNIDLRKTVRKTQFRTVHLTVTKSAAFFNLREKFSSQTYVSFWKSE